ncbi:exonuclease VII small subunit [Shinella sp. BE166]
MDKTDSGFVRLDTVSGEVSLCREQDGQIVCRMAADERAAFEKELDLLTKRVEALEKGGATGQTAVKPSLPTDEEIDRTMSIMEKMMQRFMGIVKNLEDGEEETAPGTDVIPEKT